MCTFPPPPRPPWPPLLVLRSDRAGTVERKGGVASSTGEARMKRRRIPRTRWKTSVQSSTMRSSRNISCAGQHAHMVQDEVTPMSQEKASKRAAHRQHWLARSCALAETVPLRASRCLGALALVLGLGVWRKHREPRQREGGAYLERDHFADQQTTFGANSNLSKTSRI